VVVQITSRHQIFECPLRALNRVELSIHRNQGRVDVMTIELAGGGESWAPLAQRVVRQIEALTFHLLALIQNVAANFDPEVLQWPCGNIIAPILWIYRASSIRWRRQS
jgi:hypothetical protein